VRKPLHLLAQLVFWGVAALGGLTALALAGAGLHYALDLLAQFAAPVLSLCILTAVTAFLSGRWRPGAGLLVAALALAFALHGQWFPHAAPPQPGAAPVRVYFANIWNENRDMDRAARSVAEAKPDVAAMVEFSDLHVAAEPRLFNGLPYRLSSPGNPNYDYKPRAVIASRFPIEPLFEGVSANFNIVAARVKAPGGAFRLIVVHMTRPWPFKRPGRLSGQIEGLRRLIATSPREPTLVVGDFNATASGGPLSAFARETGLTPAPAVLGDWPSPLPGPFRIAIENGFAGQGLTILDRRIAQPTGSDHRPILLRVAPAAVTAKQP
jgi:endonuclease/exonuclease/phosphatase (EEP) superfamily protein YafD